MVKYSIIVPVYRCKDYLEKCVDSIINQKINSYEILLIDDGSDDGSAELADFFAAQNDKVRVFHKENGGAASARNKGILEARGEYLIFVDGDDTIDRTLLETIDGLLEGNKMDLIIYGMSFDYYKNHILQKSELLSCANAGVFSILEIAERYQSLFDDNALSSACNKVFLMDIIKKNNILFQEKMRLYYEDYDFVVRYLEYVKTVECINKPLYHYRIDVNQTYNNGRGTNLSDIRKDFEHLFESVFKVFGEEKNTSVLRVSANLYLNILRENIMNINYSVSEIKTVLKEYCLETHFRKVLSLGIELTRENQKLLEKIDQGKYKRIYFELKRKRTISSAKKIVKKIIRR